MTTKITFNPSYSPATGGVIFSIHNSDPAPACKICGKDEVFTGGELIWVEGLCKDCLGWTWTWILQKGLKVL